MGRSDIAEWDHGERDISRVRLIGRMAIEQFLHGVLNNPGLLVFWRGPGRLHAPIIDAESMSARQLNIWTLIRPTVGNGWPKAMIQWVAEVAGKSDPPGIAWPWRVRAVACAQSWRRRFQSDYTLFGPFDGVYDSMVNPGQVLVSEQERFVHGGRRC